MTQDPLTPTLGSPPSAPAVDRSGQPDQFNRSWHRAGALAACLLLLVTILPISLNWLVGRAAWDQLHFHLPAILIFAEQLPTPDLVDYASATTPGYHLVLAVVSRVCGVQNIGLRMAGLVFSLSMAWLLAWWVASCRSSVWAGVLLTLPLLVSFYFYSSAVWLLPDNAGWLGVFCILALLLRGRVGLGLWLALGLLLLALVLVRQIHLWVMAPMIAAAWLDAQRENPAHPAAPPLSQREVLDVLRPTVRTPMALATVFAVSAPGVAAIVCFALAWGGLVPLRFQNAHNDAWSWAAPAFFCSLTAGIGVFFIAWWWAGLKELITRRRGVLLAAGVFGLLVALMPQTSYSFEQGRYGAFWSVVERLPEIGERSLLVAVTAPIGAIVLTSWLLLLGRRDRWIMMAACAGFMAASSANSVVAQRYFEPMVLIFCAMLAARTLQTAGNPLDRFRLRGPLVLAVLMAGLTTLLLLRSGRIDVPDQPQGTVPLATDTAAPPTEESTISEYGEPKR